MPWVCDVLSFAGEELLAPVVTGAAAGLAVWWALRLAATPAEVERHDRRISQLNDDLRRFVRDLGREVDREFQVLTGAALSGRLEGIRDVQRRRLPEWLAKSRSDSRIEGLRDQATELMRDALWRFRDEAVRKYDEYVELAREESRRHRRRRRRKGIAPASLAMPGDCRRTVATWRRRPDRFGPDQEVLTVDDDPTAEEPKVAIVESEAGLMWEEARAR